MTPEGQWRALTAAIVLETAEGPAPAVLVNANSLKSNGKMFANFAKDSLVLKLSPERVDDLEAAGVGRRQDVGTGPLKEWLVVPASAGEQWLPLAREAIVCVGPKKR